ncbi:scube2 [Symbiodinium sp. CCMP2592]|nr:scube2 [Symbiodinium sp. CCMP2592]
MVAAVDFQTESLFDYLTIESIRYSGTDSPQNVEVFQPITWLSNAKTAGQGWQLCRVCESTEAPGSCVCQRGYEAAAGACQQCRPGYFKKNASFIPCSPCPGGTASTAPGALACAPCGVGEFSTPGAAACELCPAGRYAIFPQSPLCTECQQGTYSTVQGAFDHAVCMPCPEGSTTLRAGANASSECISVNSEQLMFCTSGRVGELERRLDVSYAQAKSRQSLYVLLRGITDLWSAASIPVLEGTAEQSLQRRTNMTNKLSKRLAGNNRAKIDLAVALQQWFIQMSQHTIGLLAQVRALGQRLDEDTDVAAREMRSILAEQPSETTASQVERALAGQGPIWMPIQENEVMQIAARTRAFGMVQTAPHGGVSDGVSGPPLATFMADLDGPPLRGTGDMGSEASFGAPSLTTPVVLPAAVRVESQGSGGEGMLPGPSSTVPVPSWLSEYTGSHMSAAPAPTDGGGMGGGRGGRWRKRGCGAPDRPSKSPRREGSDVPWPTTATGLTPEGIARVPQTLIAEEDPELLPAREAVPPVTWSQAWLHMLRFAVDNGAEPVGELAISPEQDATLPISVHGQPVSVVCECAEKVWQELVHVLQDPLPDRLPLLFAAILNALQLLRGCPQALPQVRQGVVVAAQVSAGGLLDPYSYAPATAQEWLFPSLLVEKRGPFRGFVAEVAAQDVHVQTLITQPCPFEPQELLRCAAGCLAVLPCCSPTMAAVGWGFLVSTGVDRRQCPRQTGVDQCPFVLQADVRAHGALLFRWIGTALQLRWDQWHFRRQVELVSALPTEQYVLSEWSLAWHQVQIPVDLRPIGGVVALAEVHRNQPCGQVIQHVASMQGCPVPADLLCRVGAQWFTPEAYTLFADAETIREAVRRDYTGTPAGAEAAPPYFERILPPLPHLPAIQFLSDSDIADLQPFALDLRPVGEGIHVAASLAQDPPIARLHLVLERLGQMPGGQAISADLAQGGLTFLHNEQCVPAEAPLMVDGAVVLTIMRLAARSSAEDALESGVGVRAGHAGFAFSMSLGLSTLTWRQCSAEKAPDTGTQAGDTPAVDVRQALLAAGGLSGRQMPVLAQPQLLTRSVILVAPIRDPDLVTVLVDVGTSIVCLDVGRGHCGTSIMQALALLFPHSLFRLEFNGPVPLRNGDVVVARLDQAVTMPDMGAWSLASRISVGAMWLAPHVPVYLTTADSPLQLLRVPHGFTKSQLLEATLDWFGVPADKHDFLRLPLDLSMADLYCWIKPGLSTLTVLLTDVSDCSGRPVVQTVAVDSHQALTVGALTTPGRPQTVFWQDVLARQPVVLRYFALSPEQTKTGRHFVFMHLGVDFCRAAAHGWRLSQSEGTAIIDMTLLQLHHFGTSVDLQSPATFHDKPLLWPAAARPVSPSYLLKRRGAKGCTPAIMPSSTGQSRQLPCPSHGVVCSAPCPGDFLLWAIRVGEWVKVACTSAVEWQHVMWLGGLTSWDMPGVAVHGHDQVWNWPADLSSLAGQCGHLMQEGQDPFICDVSRGLLFRLGTPPNVTHGDVISTAVSVALTRRRLPFSLALFGLSLLLAPVAQAMAPDLNSEEDTWEEFQLLLREAGFHEEGPQKWWIVRDGLSRELLRPVLPWTDDTGRRVLTVNSHGGDFVWTTPRIVQGVAHLLHVPSGSAPPMLYWLMHYRGRAAVMGTSRAVFDWQQVGQFAAEEFGHAFFGQGQFAVWHGGRVISFGSQVPAPAHGTIVTLVRTAPIHTPGLTAWDTPSESAAAFHFEYDICRGPGGESPIAGELCAHVGPLGPLRVQNEEHGAVERGRDYARRRGWQPIVAVQPQPNDQAIHLIPSAADNSLVVLDAYENLTRSDDLRNGPQGVHESPASATQAAVVRHYQQTKGPWIRDLIPVWPSLKRDQLVFVPDVDPVRRCVCVVFCEASGWRSLLLPDRCGLRMLSAMLTYLTGRDVRDIGLPPAVQAATERSVHREVVLRPADVLVEKPRLCRRVADWPIHSLTLWDHIQWAEPFVVAEASMAAFWHPAINRPIFHAIQAGARWDPTLLTFGGDFQAAFLGKWVPVMWQPASCPHFIQASTRPGRVHILHESREGVFPMFFTSRTSRAEVAEELHTLPEYVEVPSATLDDIQGPLTLRDGDVVLDLYMYDRQSELATILVYAADQVRALLVPRKFTVRELTAFLRQSLPTLGTSLRTPPALRQHKELPSMHLHLGDGDTFAWHLDLDHPLFHESTVHSFRCPAWLPHHNPWHAGFILRHGGWVWLWTSDGHPDTQCERHWLDSGSQWHPGSLQFVRPRCAPTAERWVPAGYHEDGRCHFVRQSVAGSARVLLHRPYSGEYPECCLIEPDKGVCTAPDGWSLAPSLRRRMGETVLRDGDVLVPAQSAVTRLSPAIGWALLAGLSRRAAAAFLLSGIWWSRASAMLVPDEGRVVLTVRTGKFPWRVDYADRALHETVQEGQRCRLLSPFAVQPNQTFEANPDDTVEEVRLALTGSEPAWSFDLTPVWPSPSPLELTLVPVAPAPSLACVLIVTPDWQLPMLIPQRADANWVLAYIRSVSPGPVHGIKPPLGAQPHGASHNEAVNWRDGDLLLAFPTDIEFSAIDMPAFRAAVTSDVAAHVRHTALWSLDFYVDVPLDIVLWRPGKRPVATKVDELRTIVIETFQNGRIVGLGDCRLRVWMAALAAAWQIPWCEGSRRQWFGQWHASTLDKGGVYVNTLVDALATCACKGGYDHWLQARTPDWLPPEDAAPAQVDAKDQTASPPAVGLHLLTANIQSIKDPGPNPLNPSGHGARRQHLYSQLQAMQADVICLQETRAPAGRWATGGWLTRRSGGQKGQYGCEIWLRPSLLHPPLTLDSCRILESNPRCLVITCTDPRLPVTFCSAHAPHADRPPSEAVQFWADLRNVLQRAPSSRALVVGIDANGDFCARDPTENLIGSLVAAHEATSNDEFLYELATALALEAPATFSDVQVGAGWSWEHTSGRRKRLDHLLFNAGSWAHQQACQAWDFDIVNSHRDHVALRVRTQVHPRVVAVVKPRRRKCTGAEILAAGESIWNSLPDDLLSGRAHHHQCLYAAALVEQEQRLQQHVHQFAKRDKSSHFLSLTLSASEHWHTHGRPMDAITHLRWASRRAAERRQVSAAGGFAIEPQLEEQFRAQEQAIKIPSGRLAHTVQPWLAEAAPMCTGAMPSLIDMEVACRRQSARKAPGPDGVINELWKGFPAKAGKWLWAVTAKIALTGKEPYHFKAAVYCALYKKGPAALPQNYRAIALLNGVAKIWHGPGIPVGFALAAYRLIFHGEALADDAAARPPDTWHLAALAEHLANTGALELLGVPAEERALFQDCVAYSHWHLAGSESIFVASRGSRPGDGLADILFGALFAVALRHIRQACSEAGVSLQAAGAFVGLREEVLPLGWADDLAIVADFRTPQLLELQLPVFASIVLSTLELLRFRINLGPSKTEFLLDVRGPGAKHVRGYWQTRHGVKRATCSRSVGPRKELVSLCLTPMAVEASVGCR